MLVTNLKTESDIWATLVDKFPWVEEERGEIGEGLAHLDFAALRRGLERAAESRDSATVSDILALVEQLFEDVDTLHPEVANALEVSFLEDLYLGEPQHRDAAVPHLGPRTRERWAEIVDAHRRLSG